MVKKIQLLGLAFSIYRITVSVFDHLPRFIRKGEEVVGSTQGQGHHACARGFAEKLLQGTE